jgi:glycosyltransferase involved in cell wall biosynthesis
MLAKEQASRGFEVEVIYLKDDPELFDEFTSCGVNVNSRFAGLPFFLQCVSLRKYLNGEDVLLHAHLPRAELLTALANQKNPVLASRHNSEAFFPGKNRILSLILSRIVTAKNKNLIAISIAVEEYLLASREISKKTPIRVIYYGFDFSETVQSIRSGNASSGVVFGTISRLVPQKDLQTLLRAFAIFLSNNKVGTLRILGVGPELESLKNLAHELSIESFIEFTPRTKNVKGFLSNLDIFILTSKYEGFGLVLLEAIDSHIPIIATRTSAIPEVLGDNFPGLVPVGDFNFISSLMLEMNQHEKRQEFVRIQNKRKSFFSIKRMTDATSDFYDWVLEDWAKRKT